MQRLQYLAAFVYGFVLVFFVCVWMAGFMAAREVPVEYFKFFADYGHRGKELGLAVLSLAQHFVPTVCLLVLGVVLPAWLSTSKRRQIGLSILLGGVVSYFFWAYFYSLEGQPASWFQQLLATYAQAPWWAIPAMVAPFVGLLSAYVLLAKLSPQPAGA